MTKDRHIYKWTELHITIGKFKKREPNAEDLNNMLLNKFNPNDLWEFVSDD